MNVLHVALQMLMLLGADSSSVVRSGIYDVTTVVFDGNVIEGLSELDTIKFVSVMCYMESGFKADAEGFDGLGTYGFMQLSTLWASKEVLIQKRENIKVGIRVINHLTQKCGSLKSALGAYMTGICGGAPVMTSSRCRMAGLSPNCRPV